MFDSLVDFREQVTLLTEIYFIVSAGVWLYIFKILVLLFVGSDHYDGCVVFTVVKI